MREAAPPYRSEGPHALWHVSEDREIERFEPRLGGIATDPVVLRDDPFEPHGEVGGYWIARSPVAPLERVELADLLARHAEAGIELRIVPDLLALWDRVIASTLEYSGIRLRNAVRAG